MTENNKPIMIGGVDVSECEAISTYSDWCSFWEEKCAKNPDCVHKKYLRKKQECEELKNKNNILKEHSRYYKDECKRRKKEIGRLKEEKEQAEQKLEKIKDIANDYNNCDDVGHYVQDTEARHALEEVAQAMCDISQIIDEDE